MAFGLDEAVSQVIGVSSFWLAESGRSSTSLEVVIRGAEGPVTATVLLCFLMQGTGADFCSLDTRRLSLGVIAFR